MNDLENKVRFIEESRQYKRPSCPKGCGSVLTLFIVGILELLIGEIGGSIIATADGIDSLSDAIRIYHE